MEPLKANIVDNDDLLLNRGDILPITGNHGLPQLALVCPGCGKISSSAGKHVFDANTISYHPSIVHDKNLGGCGWHGWLKNGYFTS